MERKVKVLVWSDLVVKTGFERVSKSIFENLTNQLDIVGLGINYRGDPTQYKFPVFPASLGGDLYGINRLSQFVNDGIDLIYILNDVWVIDRFLEKIKEVWKGKKIPRIVTYFPVDAEEHDPNWYRNFDIVDVPVTYTEFAKKVVLKAAPQLKDRLRVIPHGTDTSVIYKQNKFYARSVLFGEKATPDEFIFLNAGRNQPRKKLDVTLEAFKLFSEGKEDTRLYMHCGYQDMHMDLARLSTRLGIDRKLILTNLNRGPQQVSDETLNLIFNSCDAGVNTGLGEGWGLPSVEHASVGAPQIVPGHSACRELFQDCGVLVPAKVPWVFDNIMTVGYLVQAEDVAKAMDKLYTNRNIYNDLSKKSIDKFTAEQYQWKTISKTWLRLFEELDYATDLAEQPTEG